MPFCEMDFVMMRTSSRMDYLVDKYVFVRVVCCTAGVFLPAVMALSVVQTDMLCGNPQLVLWRPPQRLAQEPDH